ncbi:hypothetical protein BKI52_03265 [marine bacterium AO1-C]|nr:hypothetical protein BKI52_03265 [marine bacterium AO1-C]
MAMAKNRKNTLPQRKRMYQIVELLKTYGCVSRQFLANKLGVHANTITTDIRAINHSQTSKYDHDVIVNKSQKKGGYELVVKDLTLSLEIELNRQQLTTIRRALENIRQYDYLPLFTDYLNQALEKLDKVLRFHLEETKQHIYFEPIPSSPSAELFEFFLKAIEDQAEVCFHYQSPKNSAGFYYSAFQPYALKEYGNRWYVVGYYNSDFAEHRSINTLAVDRVMDNHSLTGNHFEPKQGFDMTKHFVHSLGMTVDLDVPIENVVLEFEHIQGKFFASKPFHKPYETQDSYEDGTPKQVSMQLRPNFDLTRKLVEMGAGVKVLAPKSLVESVMAKHQAALDQYK